MHSHISTVCHIYGEKTTALIALINSVFLGTMLFRQLFLSHSDGSLLLLLYSIPLHLEAVALLGRAISFGAFPDNKMGEIGVSVVEGFIRISVAAFLVQRSSGFVALRRACGLSLAMVLIQVSLSYDKIIKNTNVPMDNSEFGFTNYYYLFFDSFSVSTCLVLGLYYIVQSRKRDAQPLVTVSVYIAFLNICFLSWFVNDIRLLVFGDHNNFSSCWELATSAFYFIFHPPALYLALRAASLQWRHIGRTALLTDLQAATEQQQLLVDCPASQEGADVCPPSADASVQVIDFLALRFHECIGEGASARVWRATLMDTWGINSEGGNDDSHRWVRTEHGSDVQRVQGLSRVEHGSDVSEFGRWADLTDGTGDTGAGTGAARMHRRGWCWSSCSRRSGVGREGARTSWGGMEVAVKVFNPTSGCKDLSMETAREQLAKVVLYIPPPPSLLPSHHPPPHPHTPDYDHEPGPA
jgi:hypothetical protein